MNSVDLLMKSEDLRTRQVALPKGLEDLPRKSEDPLMSSVDLLQTTEDLLRGQVDLPTKTEDLPQVDLP
jgi:hypothetical protein